MKHEVLDLQLTDFATRTRRFAKEGVFPFLMRNPVFGIAIAFSLLSAIYWLFIASDRYVSEAHVIIQRTEIAANAVPDVASLLTGNTTGNRADQLILRDYLRSKDMVRKLDNELDLRDHYTKWTIDPFSRMGSDPTEEQLSRYYLDRVNVEYDDYSGVLVIKAEGFDPIMAQKITQTMVRDGENFMNSMAHGLADDQVEFLERQVSLLGGKAMKARRAVLNYQNRNGLVSPEGATEAITRIVARMEAQRTQLETRMTAMQAYLVDDHPRIVQLQQQIDAINEQIDSENARLASPQGNSLNTKIEEFQRLQLQAEFAQDMYKSALVALEKGRVEATRSVKKMSIVQEPSLPTSPGEPKRLKNVILYMILAMLVAGAVHLVLAIIKDHRD